MFWDYLESTLQLILTIVMLLGCLFQYINSKKRGWIYLVLFFLGTLVSSYHWTAYLIIMGEQPKTTDAITYIGWNFAFAALLLLLWQLKTPEERRYFHPLMLLPIPINIYQLTLYLPFGGEAIMQMLGGFTVLRLTGMIGMVNVSFTKEELLKMNKKLNRIKKPKKN